MQIRRIILGLTVLIVLGCVGCGSSDDASLQPPETDMTGNWEFMGWTTEAPSDIVYGQMALTQDGNKITGTQYNTEGYTTPVTGTISGTTLRFVFDYDAAYGWHGANTTLSGTLNPQDYNQASGDWQDDEDAGQWLAQRIVDNSGSTSTGSESSKQRVWDMIIRCDYDLIPQR